MVVLRSFSFCELASHNFADRSRNTPVDTKVITSTNTNDPDILLAIMSPRNELFQAIPFDASSDANEPLIAAGDAEEEHQGLDEKALSSFKLSSLLLGLFVGFFIQFSTLGANCLAIWGNDFVMKSNPDVILFSLLWSLFTSAMPVFMLVLIRNLVKITCSAIGSRSEELLEELILQLDCRFGVGTLAGFCVAWTITDVLLGMRAQVAYSLFIIAVAFAWYKMMMASSAESKPSSTHRSTVEQTMMTVC
jgi:hypothetical protein